ncbi:hypothetical protein LTR08_009193 [Meristemomyces frigidus]|nr:hypothetical protein LTR08_009193 [Meristemomyces frigidus]
MKFTAPLFLAAALTATNVAATDQVTCLTRHPNIYNAINQLCARNNIVVPSAYAANGVSSGGKWAGIAGSCNPKQWVPEYWCRKQMMSVCAAAGDGLQAASFGKNGCQRFIVK